MTHKYKKGNIRIVTKIFRPNGSWLKTRRWPKVLEIKYLEATDEFAQLELEQLAITQRQFVQLSVTIISMLHACRLMS